MILRVGAHLAEADPPAPSLRQLLNHNRAHECEIVFVKLSYSRTRCVESPKGMSCSELAAVALDLSWGSREPSQSEVLNIDRIDERRRRVLRSTLALIFACTGPWSSRTYQQSLCSTHIRVLSHGLDNQSPNSLALVIIFTLSARHVYTIHLNEAVEW